MSADNDHAPQDATAAARRLMRPDLPKRFYAAAASVPCEGGYGVALDGRPVRTPAKALLAVPEAALAEALAAEWAAQGERIDPTTMPLTRLVNVALDAVAARRGEVAEEVVKYAGSDLLCYRAEGPEGLVERQTQAWDPVLAWARDDLDLRFILVEGVTFADQPPATLERVGHLVSGLDPLRLAALHTVMTLTGSALLALAVLQGRLDAEAAWGAAHVDEDWNAQLWGRDEEALARRATRWTEMAAAARLLALHGDGR